MKRSKLAQKQESLVLGRLQEEQCFERVLYEISHGNQSAVLNFFLDAYTHKFPKSVIKREDCYLVWNGTLLVIDDTQLEHIIFMYGPNGLFPPTMTYYDAVKKHTKESVYRFWIAQGIYQICKGPQIEVAVNNVIQKLCSDIIYVISTHLTARDLLICRTLCKSWCHAIRQDRVWRRRGSPSYSSFLRTHCILSPVYSTTDPVLMEAIFFRNPKEGDRILGHIGRAWVLRYMGERVFKEPGVIRAESERKMHYKKLKYGPTTPVEHVKNYGNRFNTFHKESMSVALAYCLDISEGKGAVIWFSASSGPKCFMRIATIRTNKGYEISGADELLRGMMLDYVK